jgi:hypothetical protein
MPLDARYPFLPAVQQVLRDRQQPASGVGMLTQQVGGQVGAVNLRMERASTTRNTVGLVIVSTRTAAVLPTLSANAPPQPRPRHRKRRSSDQRCHCRWRRRLQPPGSS